MRFAMLGDIGEGNGDTGPRVAARAPSTWLADIRQRWSERRFARRQCQKALSCLECVQQERPELAGRELYHEVVARCVGSGRERAVSIVQRAEQSFAAWPTGRDVRFRDVVTYVIVDECLTTKHRAAAHTHIEAIVASAILADL